MNRKSNIRKIVIISFWCSISIGLLVLLVAAMKVKEEKNCTGYAVDISGSGDHYFIDKKDITDQLTGNGAVIVKGRSIKLFDLKKMEEKLERNAWISDAELFFDNRQLLLVKIKERQPIARVFTITGNSFYIDSSLTRLPLSDKTSARLPVFTGFPTDKEKLSTQDKLLMQQMKLMSNYIRANSFWMAQVAQVDITASRTFEIIPTIGNTIIEFGDGLDCDKKFKRLLLFYQQVISKTGFSIYERIKVQFAGQVVGVRHAAAISRYDSLQAIKNVQRLITMAQTEQDRLIRLDSAEMQTMEHSTDMDESPARIYNNASEKPSIDSVKQNPEQNSVKQNSTLKSHPPYESPAKSNPVKKQAKAVMKKKE